MPNLNESKYNFVRLINNKFLKRLQNFLEKYYFLAELFIVEYQ